MAIWNAYLIICPTIYWGIGSEIGVAQKHDGKKEMQKDS